MSLSQNPGRAGPEDQRVLVRVLVRVSARVSIQARADDGVDKGYQETWLKDSRCRVVDRQALGCQGQKESKMSPGDLSQTTG